MAICPAGHQSRSTDYCDLCGMPMASQAAPATAGPATAGPGGGAPPTQPCPNCGSANPVDALFCEACGYDFTTGTLPRAGAEAADILSIDSPVAAPTRPSSPAASAVPAAPPAGSSDSGGAGVTPATHHEANEVANDEGMPLPGQEGPAATPEDPAAVTGSPLLDGVPGSSPLADAGQTSGEEDTGAPGVTPATLEEAELVADDEGMPLPGEVAPAATRETPEQAGGTPEPDKLEFVAEVWIDPQWYRVQQSSEQMPSPGLPEVVPLRSRKILIGRPSQSRNIYPDIDAGSDSGVSRRQAQLTYDGQRWFVEDLDSSNGTYVGSTGTLPETAIVGRHQLADDDRIYVGAWTRIVLRPATPDERAAHAA